MRVDHILNRIRDQVPRWQAVKHAVVPHGDTVVHCDRVEFFCDAASGLDFPRYQLPKILEMHMSWHKLGEGIDHRDNRLFEVFILHAGGPPQRACARHVAAGGRGAGSILRHRSLR